MSQVRLENIRRNDIEEGREKETLALIWAIILHYQSELKWNYALHDAVGYYNESHNSRNCCISCVDAVFGMGGSETQHVYTLYILV